MKNFSIGEALKYGWETTKSNFLFLVLITFIIGLISTVPSLFSEPYEQNAEISPVGFFVTLVFWVLSMLVSIGGIKIILGFLDKKKPQIVDLFNGYPLLIKFVIASVLYGLIVLVGFIFLIIPGIYFAVKYQFFSYLLVDKNVGPIESLKQSAVVTNGVKWKLILLGIIMVVINILGLLAFVIGIFVTAPVTSLAYGYIYRKLLNSANK